MPEFGPRRGFRAAFTKQGRAVGSPPQARSYWIDCSGVPCMFIAMKTELYEHAALQRQTAQRAHVPYVLDRADMPCALLPHSQR
jgi:hypothetical protein